MKKVGLVLLIVAVVITIPLFAADVTWYWEPDNQNIDLYRYRIDSQTENWTIAGNSISSATFFDLNDEDDISFTLQYSEDDGKSWSKSINSKFPDENVKDSVRIIWDMDDFSDNCFVRYSTDGTRWTDVDKNNSHFISEDVAQGEETTFSFQFSSDGVNWDDSVSRTLKPYAVNIGKVGGFKPYISMRFSFAPLTMGIFDFYNGHDVKGARYLTASKYGLALDIELDMHIHEAIDVYLSTGYALALKNRTVIENAEDVHYFNLSAGLDFRLFSFSNLELYLGAFAGPSFNLNGNYMNFAPVLGGRVRLDMLLTENVTFSLQSRVSASYHHNDEPLYRSMTYLVDMFSFAVEYRL